MRNYKKIIFLASYIFLINNSYATINIVCGPSGVGKSSVINAIRDQNPQYKSIISYTTRPARHGEKNGQDYNFITEADFLNKQQNNFFLSSTKIYGNYYGHSKKEFLEALSSQNHYINDLKSEVASNFKEQFAEYKDKIKVLCLNPPSLEELKNRLKLRDGSKSPSLDIRLQAAETEIKNCAKLCDVTFVNIDLKPTITKVYTFLKATK